MLARNAGLILILQVLLIMLIILLACNISSTSTTNSTSNTSNTNNTTKTNDSASAYHTNIAHDTLKPFATARCLEAGRRALLQSYTLRLHYKIQSCCLSVQGLGFRACTARSLLFSLLPWHRPNSFIRKSCLGSRTPRASQNPQTPSIRTCSYVVHTYIHTDRQTDRQTDGQKKTVKRLDRSYTTAVLAQAAKSNTW